MAGSITSGVWTVIIQPSQIHTPDLILHGGTLMTSSHITVLKSLIYTCALSVQLLISAASYADDITQQQLLERLETNTAPLLLDVRKPEEFAAGHIPKAINIPHTELDKHVDKLRDDINNEVVVYCETGRRAGIAQDILKQAGFTKVLHLQGDMKAWREHDLPTDGGDPQQMP